MIQSLNNTDRLNSNDRPVRNVPGGGGEGQRGVGARRTGRKSEAFSVFDTTERSSNNMERSQVSDRSAGLGQQWRLASYLRRTEVSRDPVITPRQTSGTGNNSSTTSTPATPSSSSTSSGTATSNSTTPPATTQPTAATAPLTTPTPIEVLTAALRSAGVDTSGIKMSEHWDFVSYPGGGYHNHLITVESAGRTENIMVNLMTMDPRVAVGDIQRMIGRPAIT